MSVKQLKPIYLKQFDLEVYYTIRDHLTDGGDKKLDLIRSLSRLHNKKRAIK